MPLQVKCQTSSINIKNAQTPDNKRVFFLLKITNITTISHSHNFNLNENFILSFFRYFSYIISTIKEHEVIVPTTQKQ